MSSHTPGPWRVTGNEHYWQIDAEYDAVACNSFCYAAAGQPETSLANARLIAAAPDLLESLKRLSQLADAIWVQMSDGEMALMREAWEKADAAIAKAEGR